MGPARPPDYRFEIAGVPPGSYVAFAQFGDRQQQQIAMQPVEVQNRHVDNVMLAPAPGADVTGTVKVEDASGAVDVSRLNVTLSSPASQFGPPPRGKVADGAFVMKGVAPLRYEVRVSGLPEGSYLKSISYGGREVPAGGIDIAGGAIDVVISAAAGEITAAAVDKDGKPCAGATVALIPSDGGTAQGNTADENGAVTFRGLKPGDYTVIAWEDIPPGAYLDPDFREELLGDVGEGGASRESGRAGEGRHGGIDKPPMDADQTTNAFCVIDVNRHPSRPIALGSFRATSRAIRSGLHDQSAFARVSS